MLYAAAFGCVRSSLQYCLAEVCPLYLMHCLDVVQEKRDGLRANQHLVVPTTGMAKGLGSSGGATMERSKLSLKQETSTSLATAMRAPATAASSAQWSWQKTTRGVASASYHGAGRAQRQPSAFSHTEQSCDHCYLAESSVSCAISDGRPPVVRRMAIEAVLSEWMRTVGSLPLIMRQAVEMGLFSSAQLVRFCAMDNRPNVTRTVSRLLPASVRSHQFPVWLNELLQYPCLTNARSPLRTVLKPAE